MNKIIFYLIFFVLFSIKSVSSLQIKEVYDGAEIHAKISADDINRLRVIDDKIRSVRGNAGELELTKDPELGEVYLRVTKKNYKRPINLFVTTEKNSTYKLLLSPARIPSEQIFLRNLSTTSEPEKNKIATFYKQDVIRLYKAMYNKQKTYQNYEVKGLTGEYILTESLKVRNLRRYQGDDYRGDIVEIENISDEDQFFTEMVFKGRGVSAVKIDNLLLEPGEKTLGYVVSR